MRTVTVMLTIAGICAVCSPIGTEASDDIGLRNAVRVKAAIEQRHGSRIHLSNLERDLSALDLTEVFIERKYRLASQREAIVRPGQYRVRYVRWEAESKLHADEIRLSLVLSEGGAEKALAGLYELMSQTTLPIAPENWDVLKDGPGDVCFVGSQRGRPGDQPAAVRTLIWFCRDNIAVKLHCSGGTDLLPIARALDQAIQACKEKPVEQSKPQG